MNDCQRWKTDAVDQVVNHNQLCDWSMGMVFVLNLVMILWRKTLLSLKGSSLMEDHVVMNWSSSDARPFNFVVVNNNCQQQFSFSWITKNTRSWTLLRMHNHDQNLENHQQQNYHTDSWLCKLPLCQRNGSNKGTIIQLSGPRCPPLPKIHFNYELHVMVQHKEALKWWPVTPTFWPHKKTRFFLVFIQQILRYLVTLWLGIAWSSMKKH